MSHDFNKMKCKKVSVMKILKQNSKMTNIRCRRILLNCKERENMNKNALASNKENTK